MTGNAYLRVSYSCGQCGDEVDHDGDGGADCNHCHLHFDELYDDAPAFPWECDCTASHHDLNAPTGRQWFVMGPHTAACASVPEPCIVRWHDHVPAIVDLAPL